MQSLSHEDEETLSKARKIISEGGNVVLAVDSNAFFEGTGEKRSVSFNRAWMGKFRNLASRGEKLLLSSVWDVEVRRHFNNSIDSQVQVRLPKFVKIGSNKNAIEELNNRATALRSDALALVEKEWDSVKSSFNTELVTVPRNPELARRIFDLWSNSYFPFEKRKEKRDEFQDAFALLSLYEYSESLRKDNNTNHAAVLLVTDDNGCRKFCEQTSSLLPCSSIDAAVDLLNQRQELERSANLSCELSASGMFNMFNDSKHPVFQKFQQSLRGKFSGVFPPPCFSFMVDEQEKSGWLRSLEIDCISLLQAGPKGSLIEVIAKEENILRIKGKARFILKISLNEPCYSSGACPSQKIIISECKFALDMAFYAWNDSANWFAEIIDMPQRLGRALS